jgi:hypothetical protein
VKITSDDSKQCSITLCGDSKGNVICAISAVSIVMSPADMVEGNVLANGVMEEAAGSGGVGKWPSPENIMAAS